MAHLFGLGCGDGVSQYLRMRRHKMGEQLWTEMVEQVTTSRTLYVGNLSFYTTEEQLYEFFGMVGPVLRVVMGLNKESKTPCGFCFVEFYEREHAIAAVNYLSGMKVDERAVKLDIDEGFTEGRQYGRGRSGGQVRDEVRTDFDYGRGGWGKSATVREDPETMDERVDEVPVETSAPVKKQDNHRFREGRDSDEDD